MTQTFSILVLNQISANGLKRLPAVVAEHGLTPFHLNWLG